MKLSAKWDRRKGAGESWEKRSLELPQSGENLVGITGLPNAEGLCEVRLYEFIICQVWIILSSLSSVQCPGNRQRKLTMRVIQVCDSYGLGYLLKVILIVLFNPFSLFLHKNTMSFHRYILYSCGSDNLHTSLKFISLTTRA